MSQAHVPKALRADVAQEARHRCGYCLSAEAIVGFLMNTDHLTPESQGGPTTKENLWLACAACNSRKSARVVFVDPETRELVRLFNPREQAWKEHFSWSEEGDLIVGLTPIGRATVVALPLNRKELVSARKKWVVAGLHPPKDTI